MGLGLTWAGGKFPAHGMIFNFRPNPKHSMIFRAKLVQVLVVILEIRKELKCKTQIHQSAGGMACP